MMNEHSPECRAGHQILKEVLQILRMIRQADDGTIIERLGSVEGSSGEHVRENGRLLYKDAPENAEGDSSGEEDEIAVIKPEVGMASERFLALCCAE